MYDSTLTHVPGPDKALAEAFRVLRPRGRLAASDGDYSTTSVAIGEDDPLQACVDAMMAASVNDRWLARRRPTLVHGAGFEIVAFPSHGVAETANAAYMLTVVDCGADMLHGDGRIGEDLGTALKAEARRRLRAGTFFGHVAYASCHAGKAGALTVASGRSGFLLRAASHAAQRLSKSPPLDSPRPNRSWSRRCNGDEGRETKAA